MKTLEEITAELEAMAQWIPEKHRETVRMAVKVMKQFNPIRLAAELNRNTVIAQQRVYMEYIETLEKKIRGEGNDHVS